ncbi:DUF317 domain-containing protein [Streptomyces sp. NPDC087440]|uniref:DUF317 domain-containing protein n=1 Tax=Streptomyces sp. NPDC087440 TaxID=3365790 RepID=UPI003822BE9E
MPVSDRQLDQFAAKHAWQIPFDTSPRDLAGPGDARHVTHGLAAAGWDLATDPLSSEIVLRSPDLRHRLQFDPQPGTSTAWWRLRAESTETQPGWYAEFGALVPAEILSSLTDSLAFPPSDPLPDPFPVLEAAGWLRDSPSTAHSSDGRCHLITETDPRYGQTEWRLIVHEEGYGEARGQQIWHARFDNTPQHLVSAFITAFVDPTPLQRGMYERTGTFWTNITQEQSPLSPDQVVDAHTKRVEALRAQARAAARRQQRLATKAPAPPPRSTAPSRR